MKALQRFLIVGLCLLAVPLQAQLLKDTNWGITGSISNSNFNNIKPFSRYSITGYKAGIYGLRNITPNYEILFSLNVSRYGQRLYTSTRFIVPPNYDSTTYTVERDVFTYLNLYPHLRYYPIIRGKVVPFISIGFFTGYLLKSKNFQYTRGGELFATLTQTSGFYKLNYGLNIKAGVKINTGNKNKPFWLSFSYEPGLKNIGKGFRSNIGSKAFRTNAYSLNVFYSILK